MLFGAHRGVIVAVQPFDIHGTRMFDIVYQLDGEPGQRSARLGAEAVPEALAVGDAVTVHLVMNVVTHIEP
jgi:hypothetical protein